MKMNITFCAGAEISNIFLYYNFFEKCDVFWENDEKPFLWGWGECNLRSSTPIIFFYVFLLGFFSNISEQNNGYFNNFDFVQYTGPD